MPSATPRTSRPLRRAGRAVLGLATLAATLTSTWIAPPAAEAAVPSLTLQGTVSRKLTTVPLRTPREAYSSPAVGDITGDGVPEIVIANMDGSVEAVRADTRARVWSRSVGTTPIHASPVLVDLDRDGQQDVVIATMDGRVLWLDGPTGVPRRTFSQGAPLHCPAGVDCRPDGFFATPAVADIDGDGVLDIVAPSFDHTVYAWASSGRLLWRKYLEDTLWSSPAIADVDRDGKVEIVLGGDIWAGSPLGVPAGGLVWMLRGNGTVYSGYPKSLPGQTIWSSPALADLNGDGYHEIIVGTGANFGGTAGHKVHAFTARTRANLSGWPAAVDGNVMASPAISDLDGDGRLDVAVASDYGWVYGIRHNGQRLWRACGARYACGNGSGGGTTKAGTAVADIDADGVPEVVATLESQLKVFAGNTGAVETMYTLEANTLTSGMTPAIAEVDGRVRIVQSSIQRSAGNDWWAKAGDHTKTYILATGSGLCRADWPQFGADARRTGTYRNTFQGWAPFRCPSQFVAQQYRDFLGRALDTAGSNYWSARMHAGTSGTLLIRSFMASAEFGAVIAPPTRAIVALTGSYPRSATAIRSAANQLRQNVPLATVVTPFVAEPAIAELSDRAFVDRVWRSTYKRAPSPSELSAGEAAVAGGNVERARFLVAHTESAIGVERLRPEVDVAMTYLGMLDRAPDPGGWSYWVPVARSSGVGSLIGGFLASAEYRNRVS